MRRRRQPTRLLLSCGILTSLLVHRGHNLLRQCRGRSGGLGSRHALRTAAVSAEGRSRIIQIAALWALLVVRHRCSPSLAIIAQLLRTSKTDSWFRLDSMIGLLPQRAGSCPDLNGWTQSCVWAGRASTNSVHPGHQRLKCHDRCSRISTPGGKMHAFRHPDSVPADVQHSL